MKAIVEREIFRNGEKLNYTDFHLKCARKEMLGSKSKPHMRNPVWKLFL